MRNAERDLHRLFRQAGLAEPLPLSTLRFGLLHIHYISLTRAWFPHLLTKRPSFLLGGFDALECSSKLLLESFWRSLQQTAGDHEVFTLHPHRLQQCVPYYLHMDEGTGLRKSAVMIISGQAVFGQETRERFKRMLAEENGRSEEDMRDRMTRAQFHNARGCTYKSRMLYTILPKRWYTGVHAPVFPKFLSVLSDECQRLTREGIDINGCRYFPVCLGVKADAPQLVKTGYLTRSFQNLGKITESVMIVLQGRRGFPSKIVESLHAGPERYPKKPLGKLPVR